MYVPVVFNHIEDNHFDDMYAVERVPTGSFKAEQNGIFDHNTLAEEIAVFAIVELYPEQMLLDGDEMMDDMERLMRELEEVD